jgi:predicted ATPase/DNA-binding SARP family transcriptional activator
MTRLSLVLLGPMQITLGGQPVGGFTYNKARALLAYLIVEAGRPHQRDALAALLWPDMPDETARHNLRQALANLRGAIGDASATPPFLLVTRDTIQFNPGSDDDLDVSMFTALLTACESHAHRRLERCRSCAARMQQAISLYGGEFLAGFNVGDSAPFEEWQLRQRERLHQQALDALVYVANYHERRGDDEPARRYAQRQIELEPWREQAHRQLMRLLARGEQRSAALAQYETCRRILARDLGVEPEAATTALYERIRDTASSELPMPKLRTQNVQNFPAQTSLLIGRETELAELGSMLENPACRLITIVGPGGIGKTRLALAAGSDQAEAFANGAAFVPLAALNSAAFLAPTILAALDVEQQGQRDPREQLLDYLRAKELLLVLDNLEQLLAPGTGHDEGVADLLADMLRQAPGLALLVTSRERLALPSEWLSDVSGLRYPTGEIDDGIEGYSAVQLFVQRARQVQRQFALVDDEARAVARICRLVEGLPLAIELAAAALRTRSCAVIAASIERNLSSLAIELRGVPERQRSIWATFEHSWRLLSDGERQVFARLSVFRGGFEEDATIQVAQATPQLLVALVDKSLVRWDGVARYDMHELVRQYASEKLEQAGEVEEAHSRHIMYFLALTKATDLLLKGAQGGETVAQLEREHDNLRAALGWAMERAQPDIGLQLCISLQHFWAAAENRGEARRWFHTMLSIPGSMPEAVRAEALSMAGELAAEQGDTDQAIPLLEEALALCPQIDDQKFMLNMLGRLGYSLLLAGAYSRAIPLLEECLARARGIRSHWHIAWHLRNLGRVAYEQGDFERARHFHEESLALFRQLDAKRDTAWGFFEVSTVALYQGDYSHAVALAEESVELFEALRDKAGIAWMGGTLGWVALEQGDVERAVPYFAQGLMAFQEFGDKQNIVRRIEALAAASAKAQRHQVMAAQRAARLFGAASTLRDAIGVHLSPADRSLYEPYLAAARAQLDEATFAAAWAEGRAMTLEQAMAYALEASEVDTVPSHCRSTTIIGAPRVPATPTPPFSADIV